MICNEVDPQKTKRGQEVVLRDLDLDYISVIIPVFNGVQQGLDSVLKSVVNQNYKHMELILVDDKSDDNSKALMTETISHCPRKITIIEHDINKGLSTSWNDGINRSVGNYILLLQQDCVLASLDTLQNAIQEIKETGSDVLLGTPKYDFKNLNSYQKIAEIRTSRILNRTNEDFTTVKFSANKCDLLRRDVVKKIGLFDERLFTVGEDWLFFLKAIGERLKLRNSMSLNYFNSLRGENTLPKLIQKERKYGMYVLPIYLLSRRYSKQNSTRLDSLKDARNQIHSRILNIAFPAFSILFVTTSLLFPAMVMVLMLLLGLWGITNFKKYFLISRAISNLRLSPFFATILSYALDFVYFIGLVGSLIHIIQLVRVSK